MGSNCRRQRVTGNFLCPVFTTYPWIIESLVFACPCHPSSFAVRDRNTLLAPRSGWGFKSRITGLSVPIAISIPAYFIHGNANFTLLTNRHTPVKRGQHLMLPGIFLDLQSAICTPDQLLIAEELRHRQATSLKGHVLQPGHRTGPVDQCSCKSSTSLAFGQLKHTASKSLASSNPSRLSGERNGLRRTPPPLSCM